MAPGSDRVLIDRSRTRIRGLGFFKEVEVQNPANTFVFLDEHPDTLNDGFFMNRLEEEPKWGNLPASYHSGACGFNFTDGTATVSIAQGSTGRNEVFKSDITVIR